MSDDDPKITPFRLPTDSGGGSLQERLGRRRREERPIAVDEEGVWRPSRRRLFVLPVESPHAAATIARKEGAAARALDGVETVLFAGDLPPGENTLGPGFSGEPVLADQEVTFRGQPVALVVGETESVCRHARELVKIDYHPVPGVLTLDHALAMKSFHGDPRRIERGDAKKTIRNAPLRFSGTMSVGTQFPCSGSPLEIDVTPDLRAGTIHLRCPSLYPPLLRAAVARASGLPECAVKLEIPPVAGATGALEWEPVRLAVLATLTALKCRSAVTLRLDSADSPLLAGRRLAAHGAYDVAHNPEGLVTAVHLRLSLDAGQFAGASASVLDRALLHADSVYRIPHLCLEGVLARTNNLCSGSLPGEGAAQGTWVMEDIIQHVAEKTGLPPEEIREKNFYGGGGEDQAKTTPYGQPVDPAGLMRVWKHAFRRSDFPSRRREVDRWNEKNSSYKRGIAITPMKFGLGDPRPDRNKGVALVEILPDGSVRVRPGVPDLLDGFDQQIEEEVSRQFGLTADAIQVVPGDFDTLTEATPLLGVDTAGLCLRAIEQACHELGERLRDVALQLFAARGLTEVERETIRFFDGKVGAGTPQAEPIDYREVIEGAMRKRVHLRALGYHRTPNLWWDPELGAGWPFSAFTYAAAVTEIQVDAFTGEIEILRTDITHEGSPAAEQGERDEAQLFRAFTLGAGWILSEEPPDPENPRDEFTIAERVPGYADAPLQWETERLRPAGDPASLPGDPCAEAPVLLAASVREALWDALRAFGLEPELDIDLPLPATPPRVLSTFKEISRQLAERERENRRGDGDELGGAFEEMQAG